MAFIFCTSEAIVRKAGANINSVIETSGAAIKEWSGEAESYINHVTRRNWSDDYAGLNDDVKKILEEAASAEAAQYVINYDANGIGRSHAELRLDFLRDKVIAKTSLLRDKKTEEFMDSAT